MPLGDWELVPLEPTGTAAVNKRTGERHEYTFCDSLVRGVPHPGFIKPEIWERQKTGLRFREGDVFVCTMSKCGTTLMEQIVLLLLNGGDPDALDPLHKNTLQRGSGRVGKIWTEMAVIDGLGGPGEEGGDGKACMGEGAARMSAQDFDELPPPRVLKTHAPRQLFLADGPAGAGLAEGVKVIYVTRNPLDACVSCYYHPKPGVSPATTGWSFEAFARLWLSERIEFGGWAAHLRGWCEEKRKSGEQILWTSYEDLLLKPEASIRAVAGFLGIAADDALVRRVAEGSSFASVRKVAEGALEAGVQGDLGHLRKGVVGDWRNHFSEELRAEFCAELARLVGDLDLSFDIGETLPWRPGPYRSGGEGVVDSSKAEEAEAPAVDPNLDRAKWADIKILSGTMIFLSLLQTTLTYLNEFYAAEKKIINGMKATGDFFAITAVAGNILNGLSGGMAMSTAVISGKLVCQAWWCEKGPGSLPKRCAVLFFASIVVESVVTSGVLHSVGHRAFGVTSLGNGLVEFTFHLGYTLNVLFSGLCLALWLGAELKTTAKAADAGAARGPAWARAVLQWGPSALAALFATAGLYFSEAVKPFDADQEVFDFPTHGDPSLVAFLKILQGQVQGIIEALLLVPTVLLLFRLGGLWLAVSEAKAAPALQRTAYRLFIASVAVPLATNWIHFRSHDTMAGSIQRFLGWDHSELITYIRLLFHFPLWFTAIPRVHYFRRLTEFEAGWPRLSFRDTLCPGGPFPFLLVFIFRASEGMTFALLPMFFQGATRDAGFNLDVTSNTWVACTVLGMFTTNALGAVVLGRLMQRKGFDFSYAFVCACFVVLFPLHMLPHNEVSLFALRMVTSLIFPGPVVLSRITQATRHRFTGAFSYVPMVVSLVYFNQGFAFGGAIANSQVWTPWNVFFTASLVLFLLTCGLLAAFLVRGRGATLAAPGPKPVAAGQPPRAEPRGSAVAPPRRGWLAALQGLGLARAASFANGIAFACHIALLGIQVTNLVEVDKYQYACIVSSLGTVSTVLLLACFAKFAQSSPARNMLTGYIGHLIGTAVLSVPQLYTLPRLGAAAAIAACYSLIFLSFFVLNLACEVTVKEESLRGGADAAAGAQMGYIKGCLSVGKVFGCCAVIFGHRVHPCLPLWLVEGALVLCLLAFTIIRAVAEPEPVWEEEDSPISTESTSVVVDCQPDWRSECSNTPKSSRAPSGANTPNAGYARSPAPSGHFDSEEEGQARSKPQKDARLKRQQSTKSVASSRSVRSNRSAQSRLEMLGVVVQRSPSSQSRLDRLAKLGSGVIEA